jgi:hypothetical protein
MSMAELEHASNLMKIFEEDYKAETATMNPIPSYLCDIRKSIMDMYQEFASKVNYLHDMYNKT